MDRQPQSKAVTVLPPDEGGALVPLRFRHDGWHAGAQRQFLAELGETGCIRDACRAVGRSSTSAYKLRARSAEFAAQWDRALEMAATVLEQVAFQRAVIGVEEPVYHYGKYLGTRRRYSDALLRLLIQRGDLAGGQADPRKSKAQLVREAEAAAKRAGGSFGLGRRPTKKELVDILDKRLQLLAQRPARPRRARGESADCTDVDADGRGSDC